MIEGLWTVEFRSSIGGTGYGTVVFDGSRAMGGSAGYYYYGKYEIEGDVITGSLQVRRYNDSLVSVFGPLEEFELQLSGQVNESRMVLSGRVADRPAAKIVVVCTRRDIS